MIKEMIKPPFFMGNGDWGHSLAYSLFSGQDG